eukprot:6351921-Alexandrium_andersonii.AAC.1
MESTGDSTEGRRWTGIGFYESDPAVSEAVVGVSWDRGAGEGQVPRSRGRCSTSVAVWCRGCLETRMGGRVVRWSASGHPSFSVGWCQSSATGQLLVEVVAGPGVPVAVLRVLPAVGVCPCAVLDAGHPGGIAASLPEVHPCFRAFQGCRRMARTPVRIAVLHTGARSSDGLGKSRVGGVPGVSSSLAVRAAGGNGQGLSGLLGAVVGWGLGQLAAPPGVSYFEVWTGYHR